MIQHSSKFNWRGDRNNYIYNIFVLFLNLFQKRKKEKMYPQRVFARDYIFKTLIENCRKTFRSKLALTYNTLIVLTPHNLSRTFDNKIANYDNMAIMVIIRNKRVHLTHENRSSARFINNNDNWFLLTCDAHKNVACVDEVFNGSKNRLSMELPAGSLRTIHDVL